MPAQSSAPIPSLPGDVRIGPLWAIPEQLQAFDLDPQQVFGEAGLALQVFANPDNRIAYAALGRLFEACVCYSGCAHFGLLVGEHFDLGCLGSLGQMMRNAPTVGVALACLQQHLSIHDRGAAPVLLEISASLSLLGYSVYHHDLALTKPIHDVATAMAYRLLRELCGAHWKPQRVQFSCPRPGALQAYRRLFGSDLHFDAEIPGVIFDSSWLQQAIAGADPLVYARVGASLEAALTGMGLGEQVERILLHLLPDGHATAANVAHELGISERTLRRRLEADGCKLQQLFSQIRYELARQLLLSTRLPIADIAAHLQYDDANAFSRAFKRWSGSSPLRWRLTQANARTAG